MQAVRPVPLPLVPGGQSVQASWCGLELNEPGAQKAQRLAPALDENWPAPQVSQSVAPGRPW
jgi:hypothetical protein